MTLVVDAVFRLNGAFLATGDRLAEPSGITAAQWQVLGYLRRQELAQQQTTAAEVARSRGLRRQSVQETVNRLVGKGFLRRSSNPDDRRAPLLELTGQAREALASVDARRERWVQAMQQRVPSASLAALLAGLAEVLAALDEAERN